MASIFDLDHLAPYKASFLTRSERYRKYRAYYKGTAYDNEQIRRQAKLYAGIKTIFSPLRRAVRMDCAKVPSGWALPREASESTAKRIADLRARMGADAAYERFVLYGAVAGEAGLLLSGTREQPVVTAHRPDELVTGTLSDGRTPFAAIIKQCPEGTHGRDGRYEYAQLITPSEVQTYKDGTLHDYDGHGHTRANVWQAIPLVFSPYVQGEDGGGEPAYGPVTELLDRVNEIASLAIDVITRNAEPTIVATGVDSLTMEDGDDAVVIRNENARVYTVDPKLAIAETLQFIEAVKSEFKALMPQLSIDELRSMSDLAYDTVITLLMEMGDHVVAVRSNVDRAIEQIERLALGDVPADYAIDRDRSWMALTPQQQAQLELKQLEVEEKRRSLHTGAPVGITA